MARKSYKPDDSLYTLQTGAESYIITKYDSLGLEMLSQYIMPQDLHSRAPAGCTCPQSHKPTCRHRKMFPLMIDRIDTDWFFRFSDGTWHDPTGAEARKAVDALRETATVFGMQTEAVAEATAPEPPKVASYKEVEPEKVAEEFNKLRGGQTTVAPAPEPKFKRRI